jgi:phosphatidylserine/phosphatidylglycerophosphate/cardiolipin synthase-like enzyme
MALSNFDGWFSPLPGFVLPLRRACHRLAPVLLLAGCSLYPPADGINHSGGGGVTTIVERYHIEPLDPQSKVPLAKQALEELEKTDPLRLYRGTTYSLTEGNRLPHDWIMQTPDDWGTRAAAVRPAAVACAVAPARGRCPAGSEPLADAYSKLVASAQHSVDLVVLQPAAEGRFLAGLRSAVTSLARSGRAVTIRVIVGSYPPDGVDAKALLSQLTRDAGSAPMSRLRIYAAATRSCDVSRSCDGLSWNHAKILSVDGHSAIVGGINLWGADYLAQDPVHDISMRVDGKAAYEADRFADALWSSVCKGPRTDGVNASFVFLGALASAAAGDCLTKVDVSPPREAEGGVPILAVGRLAQGIAPVFADQSLIARDLMLGAATQSIRMVQQDVAFAMLGKVDRAWPESALAALADLIGKKSGDVYLILSNAGAAGQVGTYSNGVSLESVADKIKDVVGTRTGLKDPQLSILLCQRLHLAPLRFGPDASWPDGHPFGVHAKFWMVDDRAFYIGSENLYPTDLQEFGYIVEDRRAASELRKAYWDEAWQWSRAAAISGADAPRCHFDHPAS